MYLSPLLDLLLLSISLLHVPHEESLSQQLLGSAAGLDVQEGIVGVFNHALTESTDAQLHHGPVVQDLREKKRKVQRRNHLKPHQPTALRIESVYEPGQEGRRAGCCLVGGS